MARRGSAFGFFGIFGRSSDLRQLDEALRAVDLHPALVPEGVKLAIVNIMKDEAGGDYPPESAYRPVVSLVGYCLLGREPFEAANGDQLAGEVEHRIEAALDRAEASDDRAGDATRTDPDIALLLLLLHARLIQPSVVDRFALDVES